MGMTIELDEDLEQMKMSKIHHIPRSCGIGVLYAIDVSIRNSLRIPGLCLYMIQLRNSMCIHV